MLRIEYELEVKHLENEIENMDMKENQLKNSVGAIVDEMEDLATIRLEMNEVRICCGVFLRRF